MCTGGSVVYTPYWLALEMLKKAGGRGPGKKKFISTWTTELRWGGHFIKSKSVNVSKTLEDRN